MYVWHTFTQYVLQLCLDVHTGIAYFYVHVYYYVRRCGDVMCVAKFHANMLGLRDNIAFLGGGERWALLLTHTIYELRA